MEARVNMGNSKVRADAEAEPRHASRVRTWNRKVDQGAGTKNHSTPNPNVRGDVRELRGIRALLAPRWIAQVGVLLAFALRIAILLKGEVTDDATPQGPRPASDDSDLSDG